MMARKIQTALVIAFLLLVATSWVGAESVGFPLEGSQEVPPVVTGNSGSCTGSLNSEGTEYTVSCDHDVTSVTGAHIHNNAPGENGPIVFFFDATTSFTGVVSASSLESQAMMFPVTPITFEEFLAQLNMGRLYVNVHSPDNPGGEIRGQIPPPPSFYFPQFGNGTAGDTTVISDIVLVNTASTGSPVSATVNFLDPDGSPLEIPFEGGTNEVMIEPGKAATLRTTGEGDLVVGSGSVHSTGPIAGVLKFSIPGFGVAGVPASTSLSSFIVPVRNEGDIKGAVAMRNTSQETVTGTARFCGTDRDGLPVTLETTVELNVGARIAMFVEQIFPELAGGDFSGTFSYSADSGSVAAVALEQGPGVFTTLPVAPR